MLTPHQQKFYDAARADQLLSLERGVAPTVNELLQFAADMANSRGVEKIQTMERDPMLTAEKMATIDCLAQCDPGRAVQRATAWIGH